MEQTETTEIQNVLREENQDFVALQAICKDLADSGIARLREKISRQPCHTNRASSIGHPCPRYLYYCIENWQDRDMHGPGLQSIFEEGHEHEKLVSKEIMQDCSDRGWSWVQQQTAYHDKNYNISGHIDGAILLENNKLIPVEIKSSAPWIFDKLFTAEDLKKSDMLHLRNYYDQMQAYLFLNAVDCGIWVFKNKQNGFRKYIPVKLDYEHFEKTLKRLEIVNEARKNSVPPDRNIDLDVCEDCAFRKLCLGDMKLDLPQCTDEELLLALDERTKYTELHKKYEKADKMVKDFIKTREDSKFTCGDYIITRKWIDSTVVPEYTRIGYFKANIKTKSEFRK